MRLLRLPSSFSSSFPSVSLGTDTTYACCLFLSLHQGQQVPWVTRPVGHAADRTPAFSRVETLGSPVFPCFPPSAFDMLSDPDQIAIARLNRYFDIVPTNHTIRTPVCIQLPRFHNIPSHSLSTLRASISADYARLASGGWLALAGQDWLPAGKLRGVSLLI